MQTINQNPELNLFQRIVKWPKQLKSPQEKKL